MSDQDRHPDDHEDVPRASEPAPTTTAIQAISRRNWTRGLIGFAIALVVLVALGFAAARINDELTRTPAEIALAEVEQAPDARSATTELTTGGTATVEWSDSLGVTLFASDDLPSIGGDQQFAVWYVRGQDALLAGTFEAPSHAVLVELDWPVAEGDLVSLSVESAGAEPAEPTGEPLVSIPTS